MHTPKMPEQQEVLPEVIDETKKTDLERDRIRRRKGRASTILANAGDYRGTTGKSLLGE